MKHWTRAVFVALLVIMSCKNETTQKTPVEKPAEPIVQNIASIKGQQLTGVTVSHNRVFVNFPRWRKGIRYSVAEVGENNTFTAYPNEQWNTWENEQPITDSVFVAVQSVVAAHGKLYVVDTRNPEFKGIKSQPIIFVFNLADNTLEQLYKLPENTFHPNSYINDVRIDEAGEYAYFTDSGAPGLLVINLKTGDVKRVLDKHISTTSEVDYLTINGRSWKNTVHSDGIALDTKQGMLYYHALTGYTLYAIPVNELINGTEDHIEQAVKTIAKTSAPDGMIIHNNMLYYADLEQHKILQMDLKTKAVTTLVQGDQVKWADTFSIADGYLYYTNSRIHEANGDISNLDFTVNRIKLAQ